MSTHKTAISLPAPLFARAEALAAQLGVKRSQLYAAALEDYLQRREDARITAALNAVYAAPSATPLTLDPGLAALQAASIEPADPEDWA